MKQRNSEIEGKLQQDIQIQVSYDKKQSILGRSSTILHPLTEIRGRKICFNGQQAKTVDRLSILSPDKNRNRKLEASCNRKQ